MIWKGNPKIIVGWPTNQIYSIIVTNSHTQNKVLVYIELNFHYFALSPSRLRILNARLSDSGNYSCVPSLGESSSVMVHVINGRYYR